MTIALMVMSAQNNVFAEESACDLPPWIEKNAVDAPLGEKIARYQQWETFGSKTQGMLVTECIGRIPMITRGFSGSLPGTYNFLYKDDTPVKVYFPSLGKGYNFMRNWNVPDGNGYVADVAQFFPSTPNVWGLDQIAHLVKVEVNGGRGGGGTLHFVPSKTKVLHKDRYVQPARKLSDFLTPYSDLNGAPVQEAQAELKAKVRLAQETDPRFQEVKDTPFKNRFERGFSTQWLPETAELRISYYTRSDQEKREILSEGTCQCDEDCSGDATKEGKPEKVTPFGGEWLRTVVYDKAGKIREDSTETAAFVSKSWMGCVCASD